MNKLVNILYRSLATHGINFSNDLHGWNASKINDWISRGYHYLPVMFGVDLMWSGHAKNDDEFLEVFIPWCDTADLLPENVPEDWCLYLGAHNLEIAMYGLRTLKNSIIGHAPNLYTCDAKDLVKFQESSLRIAIKKINAGEIAGVGAWLFLGLFKILLSVEQRLWAEPNIDAVVLPSGREVVRGIRRLIQVAPSSTQFNEHWLNDSEPTLAGGYATELLIHNECQRIANAVSQPAMHVNSALYVYGRHDVDL